MRDQNNKKFFLFKNLHDYKKINKYYYSSLSDINFSIEKNKISNLIFLEKYSKLSFKKEILSNKKYNNIFYFDSSILNKDSKIKNLEEKIINNIKKELKEKNSNLKKNLKKKTINKLISEKLSNLINYEENHSIKINDEYKKFYDEKAKFLNLKKEKRKINIKIKELKNNNNYKKKSFYFIYKNSLLNIKDLKKENLKKLKLSKKSYKSNKKIDNLFLENDIKYLKSKVKINNFLSKNNFSNNEKTRKFYEWILLDIYSKKIEISENIFDINNNLWEINQKILFSRIYEERKILKSISVQLSYELLIEDKRNKLLIEFLSFLKNKNFINENFYKLYFFVIEKDKTFFSIDKKIIKRRYKNDLKNLNLLTNIDKKNLINKKKKILEIINVLKENNKKNKKKIKEFKINLKKTKENIHKKFLFDNSGTSELKKLIKKEKKIIRSKIKINSDILFLIKKKKLNSNRKIFDNYFLKIKNYSEIYNELNLINFNENSLLNKIFFTFLLKNINGKKIIIFDLDDFNFKQDEKIFFQKKLSYLCEKLKLTFLIVNTKNRLDENINLNKSILVNKGLILYEEKNILLNEDLINNYLIKNNDINFITYFKNRYKTISYKKHNKNKKIEIKINNFVIKDFNKN